MKESEANLGQYKAEVEHLNQGVQSLKVDLFSERNSLVEAQKEIEASMPKRRRSLRKW